MICLALSRPAKIAYIAPTYQQARDIAWEQLKERVRTAKPNINESRLELKLRTHTAKDIDDHSSIVLRGWESIETLRGQAFDFLVLDEVAMMRHFWEMWREVLRPTLTDRKGGALFISTPKGFNHFYELYNQQNDDPEGEWESFHFTTYDNTYIDSEEVDAAKDDLTDDAFHQEYLADFRKQTGLVYKEFMRERHVYQTANIIGADLVAGLDFGFRNPTALLTVKVDREGVYWVTDEWYKTEKTHEQVAEYVAGCGFNKVYPDPEDPAAVKVLQDKGVNCMEVVKGHDSVNAGIHRVKEMFKQGRIRVHESCINLIWELDTYSWDDKKEEKPVKENDHALDALRYVIMMNISNRRVNPQAISRVMTRRKTISHNQAT